MNKKLYSHKTDGGAEYLCTRPVEGTDEGDLWSAIVRLDGDPELLNPVTAVAPELLEFAKDVLRYLKAGSIKTLEDRKFVAGKAAELIYKAEH